MRTILIQIFLVLTSLCSVQTKSIDQKIEDLKDVTDMPYICRDTIGGANSVGCGDEIFWNIVIEKEEAIPYLIECLNDTLKTNVQVPLFPYTYTVADVAYTALKEIIKDIPTFKLLGVEFDKNGNGYGVYWEHLSKLENREKFKEKVKEWYDLNKDNLIWVESGKVLTGDCSFKHPNNGHFELRCK